MRLDADVFVEVSKSIDTTKRPVTEQEIASIWRWVFDASFDKDKPALTPFWENLSDEAEQVASKITGQDGRWKLKVDEEGEVYLSFGYEVDGFVSWSPRDLRTKCLEKREAGERVKCPIATLVLMVWKYREETRYDDPRDAKIQVGRKNALVYFPRQVDHGMERSWSHIPVSVDERDGVLMSHVPREVRLGTGNNVVYNGEGIKVDTLQKNQGVTPNGEVGEVLITNQDIAIKLAPDLLSQAFGTRRIDRRVQALADMERLALLCISLPKHTRFSALQILQFLDGEGSDHLSNRKRRVRKELFDPTKKIKGKNRAGVALQTLRYLALYDETGNPWFLFDVENAGLGEDGWPAYHIGRSAFVRGRFAHYEGNESAFRLSGGLFWQLGSSMESALCMRFLMAAERVVCSGTGLGLGFKNKRQIPSLLLPENDGFLSCTADNWARLVGLPMSTQGDYRLLKRALERAIDYTQTEKTTIEFKKGDGRRSGEGTVMFRATPAFKRASAAKDKRVLMRTISLSDLLGKRSK